MAAEMHGLGANISAPFSDWNDEDDVVELTATPTKDRPDLVERARTGERVAFGELYRLHHAAIYRLARFHLPGGEADDVVAETFLRAWQALPRYQSRGVPFVAWLYAIARHVVADMRRRGRRTEPVASFPERAVDPGHREDDRIDLAVAVAKLNGDQRMVIELKFLMDLSNEEVGVLLGRTPGAVNALQWRALRALRDLMGALT